MDKWVSKQDSTVFYYGTDNGETIHVTTEQGFDLGEIPLDVWKDNYRKVEDGE